MQSTVFQSYLSHIFIQKLKDWHLMLLALAIGAVGSILAIIQVTVPTLQPHPYLLPNEEPPSLFENVSIRISRFIEKYHLNDFLYGMCRILE